MEIRICCRQLTSVEDRTNEHVGHNPLRAGKSLPSADDGSEGLAKKR